MVAEIDRLRKENESLGGKFEVRAFGLVPGIGSHVSWKERLDGRLGQAILSIQAMKAVSMAGSAVSRTVITSSPDSRLGSAWLRSLWWKARPTTEASVLVLVLASLAGRFLPQERFPA